MFCKSTRGWPKRRVVVIDDFYDDPQRARRWATRQTFHHPEDYTGWRTAEARIFAGARRHLRHHFGPRLQMLSSREYDAAGIAFLAFASGRRAEKPAIHWDTPENTWACTVYLTPDLPADCGTSLWQHKRTGLDRAPVRDDERRLGCTCEALLEELERDSQRRARWIETDRIGHRFNRAVIYPAYRLHSATRHRGSDLEDGRLYQLLGFRA